MGHSSSTHLGCMQQTPMPHLRWLRTRMGAEQVFPRNALQSWQASMQARMLPRSHAHSFQAMHVDSKLPSHLTTPSCLPAQNPTVKRAGQARARPRAPVAESAPAPCCTGGQACIACRRLGRCDRHNQRRPRHARGAARAAGGRGGRPRRGAARGSSSSSSSSMSRPSWLRPFAPLQSSASAACSSSSARQCSGRLGDGVRAAWPARMPVGSRRRQA